MTLSFIPRIAMLVIAAAGLASCKSGMNPFKKDGGSNDPYASNYSTDGGYNPYPGQGGYASSGGGYAQAPSYQPPPDPTYSYVPEPEPSSPPRSSSSSSSSSRGGTTHTVKKGDTLYGLSRKYGSSVSKIKSANGLSSDLIRIGQKLKIP